MGPEERAKARQLHGKQGLIAAPFALALIWFFYGFDALKDGLAFLILFALGIAAAVGIYRLRLKRSDAPPGVKAL